VGPDVLAQRLRELEAAGVVRRRTLAPPAASRVYELTDRGAELEPIVLRLGRWGSRAPFPAGDAELGPDAAVLALKSLFDPRAARDLTATYGLLLDGHEYEVRVDAGALTVARGGGERAEATIATGPGTLATVLWHGRPLADAERAGDLAITGKRAAARRFIRLFPIRGAPSERGRPRS
jgi:HxlR-like helix-turn-helix